MELIIDHMVLDYKQLNKYFDMYDGKETLVSALAFENTERNAILDYLEKFGDYYEETLCEGAYISILNAPNDQKLGYSLFAIVDYEITGNIIKFKFKGNHKIICQGLLFKKEIDIPLSGKCLWGDILKIDEAQQDKGYGGIINKCLFEFAKQKGITIFMANTLFDGEYGRFGKTKYFYENKLKFKVIGEVPEFGCSNIELFKIIYRKLDDL